jgi:hypothetical protein
MEALHRKANRRAHLGREQSPEDKALRHHLFAHPEQDMLFVSGAAAGAATGSIAGPPGAIAGAVIGAAVGAVVGRTLDNEQERRHQHDEELDREIGVSDGDLGAASADQPEALVGAYSSASSGGAPISGQPTAEGPMQAPDGK